MALMGSNQEPWRLWRHALNQLFFVLKQQMPLYEAFVRVGAHGIEPRTSCL